MTATQPSVSTEKVGVVPLETLASGEATKAMLIPVKWRSEVDTSAPFESVKEAINRFGGSAVWKSQVKQLFHSEFIIRKLAMSISTNLLSANPETQGNKCQKESVMPIMKAREEICKVPSFCHDIERALDQKHNSVEESELSNVQEQTARMEKDLIAKQHEILEILKELEGTRTTVDSLKSRLHKESSEVDKFPETLSVNRKLHSVVDHEGEITPVDSILVELKQAIMNLGMTTGNLADIRAAKSEVLILTPDIERTKVAIKATEIRLLAVKKMEEESKAAEEYAKLIQKVKEADESSRSKIEAALLEVERANQSKLELIAKLEEAAEDLEMRRKVLEQALCRVEAANAGKLAAQEALRRWRSEHCHRDRHARDFRKLGDCDEPNLVTDDPRNGSKHTLSIGEILSRKLTGPDDYNTGISDRSNDRAAVSLGQIISRRSAVLSQSGGGSVLKQHRRMRKKFVFVGLSNVNIKRKQISDRR